MVEIRMIRANLLGDPRAENDGAMLEASFLETPDYRTLIEAPNDRCVVVGRRGTGKSALVYMLKKHYRSAPKKKVVSLSPDEDQMIGLRSSTKYFGTEFKKLRAGSRIIWKYALLMEAVNVAIGHHKAQKDQNYVHLKQKNAEWMRSRNGVAERVRKTLKDNVEPDSSEEEAIADLASGLHIRDVEDGLGRLLDLTGEEVFILIDKLDEGYEPDDTGVAIIDGILQAAIDINSQVDKVHATVFIRDNIHRTLIYKDPDFSRNIEGQTLRLHWDEAALFNLVSARIKSAMNYEQESSVKIWNRVTAKDLSGQAGFRYVLRLTLYRPRDLLILLNEAFYTARKSDRSQIINEDIEATAKYISNNRFEDLKKEYEAIVPGISLFLSRFKNGSPETILTDLKPLIRKVLTSEHGDVAIQQQLAFFDNEVDVIKSLYSIGFLGISDRETGHFVFCHDGRQPDTEFEGSTKVLVHPCYWIALNLTKNSLDPEDAEEIYDEYDIEISSDNPSRRSQKIGQLESQLRDIDEGMTGLAEFSEWCYKALSVIYAGALSGFEKSENGLIENESEIVAINLRKTDAWKKLSRDFDTRDVVFRIVNKRSVDKESYDRVRSRLGDRYGKLGFIVCRDDDSELRKGRDLDFVREIYNSDHKVIVKVTAKWIITNLHKLRNPQKHNEPDRLLGNIVKRYLNMYL